MKAAEEKEITHISRRESDRDIVGPQQFVFQEFMRSQFETLRSDVRADVSAEIKASIDEFKKCLSASLSQPDLQPITSPSMSNQGSEGTRTAPEENAKRKRVASRDAHMKPGQFLMKDESSISSIRELYEEYFVGINGTPSLASLELEGSKWRRYKGMRQRWHERRILIRGLERLVALHGGTEEGITAMQGQLDGIAKRGSSKSPNWAALRKLLMNSDEEKAYQESKRTHGREEMNDEVFDANTEGDGIQQHFPAWAVPMA